MLRLAESAPPRSILLVHLAALLDALNGGRGRTEKSGPHLLDALIEREAVAYWKDILGQRGVDTGLQLDIATLASFATAETKSDIKILLRSLDDLSDALEERRGAIANALYELYPGDGESIGSVQPDILSERLVVPRLLGEAQLGRILGNVRSDSRYLRMINLLNRALLNPLIGHRIEILRGLKIIEEFLQRRGGDVLGEV